MDRDFLADLFAPFGAVTIRRMFSGYAVSADEITFALVIRETLYFRVDDHNLAQFEAEGSEPFRYATKARAVTVRSYWRLPDRLLDDSDELAEWARGALGAARRAALAKASKPKRAPKAEVTKAAKGKPTMKAAGKSAKQATKASGKTTKKRTKTTPAQPARTSSKRKNTKGR